MTKEELIQKYQDCLSYNQEQIDEWKDKDPDSLKDIYHENEIFELFIEDLKRLP